MIVGFFSSRRRHTRYWRDWSSDVCSSDLVKWAGIVRDVEQRYRESSSDSVRELLEEYMSTLPCGVCNGSRLRPESLAVTDRKSVVEGKSVDLGGRRIIQKRTTRRHHPTTT